MTKGLNETLNLTGKCLVELFDAKTGKLKWRKLYKNLVVTAGKVMVAEAIRGNVTNNQGQITYCAVGTGTTAPAAANVKLEAEIFRKLISIRSATNHTAEFKTFFNQNEANGTLREAGLFGYLATATKDSGSLFARLAINRTKSSSDTLTLTWMVTV